MGSGPTMWSSKSLGGDFFSATALAVRFELGSMRLGAVAGGGRRLPLPWPFVGDDFGGGLGPLREAAASAARVRRRLWLKVHAGHGPRSTEHGPSSMEQGVVDKHGHRDPARSGEHVPPPPSADLLPPTADHRSQKPGRRSQNPICATARRDPSQAAGRRGAHGRPLTAVAPEWAKSLLHMWPSRWMAGGTAAT